MIFLSLCYGIIPVSGRGDGYCLFVTLHKDSTPGITYHSDYCDERNTGAQVMCQYQSDNTGMY